MSHYINAFLIEPVVRQARRFSRPSDDEISPQPAGSQLTPQDQSEISHPAARPAVAVSWASTWRHELYAATTTTPESEVLASSSDEHQSEAPLRGWRESQHRRLPLRQAEVLVEEDPTASERSDNVNSDDQISSNPVYRIPDSLRSTTSSLDNSVQPVMDSGFRDIQDPARILRQHFQDEERQPYEKRVRRLPADDGMGSMRKRIVAIQRTNSSSTEKARMIHDLMTEQYNSSQSSLHASQPFRARSPASLASHDRPITPASLRSMDNSVQCTSPPTSLSSAAEAINPFNLTTEDLEPTFYKKSLTTQQSVAAGNQSSDRQSDGFDEEMRPLGCLHYKRNIKLQCSACYRWYTCRFCHDEVEDHSLNRRATKNMLCMLCGCAQPASEECSRCGERSARYYCSVCKLWDDDPGKSIYHCNDCGICRIGQGLGKDFYHCKVSQTFLPKVFIR